MANLKYTMSQVYEGTVGPGCYYYICDTDAGKPVTGLNVGDLAWAVDVGVFYVATGATTWSQVNYAGVTSLLVIAQKLIAESTTVDVFDSAKRTVEYLLTNPSGGNSLPRINAQGTAITAGGLINVVPTAKVAININGTVYYLLATTLST